ncbi:odorant receptor [Holotrichia oblita]|uniref:Odorant receptor n=1 Tax=Holotrichia oblita TaxID=644536 RepID=A0ACB9TWG4_HOLOL|nr:odorant receptor [Holotrichia oblita]
MRCMFVLGAYCFEFHNKAIEIVYRIYSFIIKVYFITFVICEYIELLTMPNKDLFNVASILAVAFLYSTTIWRMLICNGKSMRKLLKQQSEIEKNILQCKNNCLKQIYYEHVKWNYTCTNFIYAGIVTVFLYYIRPIMEERSSELRYLNITKNNITTQYKMRPLPLSSWFPFNRYNYYYPCYAYHIIAAMIGGSMVVSTDLFFIAFMVFVIGQLKILQYLFKNASKLGNALQESSGTTYNIALTRTVRYCIYKHQLIIKYVKDLDKSMSRLMLIDFAVASMQMATLGLQIIVVSNKE